MLNWSMACLKVPRETFSNLPFCMDSKHIGVPKLLAKIKQGTLAKTKGPYNQCWLSNNHLPGACCHLLIGLKQGKAASKTATSVTASYSWICASSSVEELVSRSCIYSRSCRFPAYTVRYSHHRPFSKPRLLLWIWLEALSS